MSGWEKGEEESRTAEQSRQQEILSGFATTIAKSFLDGFLPVTQNCIVVNEVLLISQ